MHRIGKAFTAVALSLPLFAAVPYDARAQTPAAGVDGTLVVVSGGQAEALLIEPGSRRVLGRFPTGPDPRGVALSPDGRYAYVTSYGLSVGGADAASGSPSLDGAATTPGAGGVTVIDIAERRLHAVFDLGEYTNFDHVRVGSRGRKLWMTSTDDGIVEMDTQTGKVTMLWKTGGIDASTLTLSPDDRLVYVTNAGSDEVTVIDRVTVVPTSVRVGDRPEGIQLSSDGRELWVANSGDNTITILKARRLDHVATFESGGIQPTQLTFHPAGYEVWVSHRGSREVTVIDRASAGIIGRVSIEGEPSAIAFSQDGEIAYVSVPGSHRVVVVDVRTREVIDSLDAGQTPMGVAWSWQGGVGGPSR
ncbi:MAG: YncE family protein [Gemmatimonadota bacterium]|nr:YncE family protein [Gemmatimonadota bacterium]